MAGIGEKRGDASVFFLLERAGVGVLVLVFAGWLAGREGKWAGSTGKFLSGLSLEGHSLMNLT